MLTAGSMAIAFALARRRSRIRPGFDVARAVVAVGGIIVVALPAHTWAPAAAMVPAIVAGLGLGFAQGAALQVSRGAGGFYARRSPIAIGLWGVGIIVAQAAGIAARTGLVQAGQAVAWFSACLGIGLIAGRDRPLRRARQGVPGGAVVAVLLTVALPLALLGVSAPAAAQEGDLTAEEVCDLIPAYEGQYGPGEYDPAALDQCTYSVFLADGVWLRVILRQWDSEAVALNEFDYMSQDLAGRVGSPGEPIDIGDEARHWASGGSYETLVLVGRFTVHATGLGFDTEDVAREVTAAVAAIIPPPTTTTTSAATTTTGATSTTAPGTGPTTTVPSGGGPGTTLTTLPSETGGPSGGASEAITPGEAAAQAIAGLIAAAAIGAISWVEAATGIQEILGGGDAGVAPPAPPPADGPAVAGTPAEEPSPTGRRPDPCAFQQERYEGALRDWQRIQSEIDALRSEYRALQLQIEAERARDLSGAVFDLGMMGKDLLGAEPPTPGVFKAMVEAAGQEFVRSIMKQSLQAAASGQVPDPEAILLGAADGAVGASDLVSGKLPGGAFGEFFAQSITALLAANQSYDYLRFMDTLAAPGAIADPEVMRALEQSSFEMYFERIGPWVGVVTRSIDLYYKNKEWGEGVEKRNGMRDELTRIATRIAELEYDLGYAAEARDSFLGFVTRCREETR